MEQKIVRMLRGDPGCYQAVGCENELRNSRSQAICFIQHLFLTVFRDFCILVC
jgi:hypothetical protein